MVKFESDCLECGLPCKGRACPHYEVAVHYCDCCGEEMTFIYEDDGDEVCESCLLERHFVE